MINYSIIHYTTNEIIHNIDYLVRVQFNSIVMAFKQHNIIFNRQIFNILRVGVAQIEQKFRSNYIAEETVLYLLFMIKLLATEMVY